MANLEEEWVSKNAIGPGSSSGGRDIASYLGFPAASERMNWCQFDLGTGRDRHCSCTGLVRESLPLQRDSSSDDSILDPRTHRNGFLSGYSGCLGCLGFPEVDCCSRRGVRICNCLARVGFSSRVSEGPTWEGRCSFYIPPNLQLPNCQNRQTAIVRL